MYIDLWTFKLVYSLNGSPILCRCLRFDKSVINEYDDYDDGYIRKLDLLCQIL